MDRQSEPVATLGDAEAWLFTHSDIEEWLFDDDALVHPQALPKEVRLVCDMFWVRERDLIMSLRKFWNSALMPKAKPAPHRQRNRAGWR